LTFGRESFAALIPHRGRMCLLERVLAYDDDGILCAASSHRAADHPLAAAGRLDSAVGLEYAAQAAAIHGGLLAQRDGAVARPGFLAGARDLRLFRERLDDLPGELVIRAERLLASSDSLLYGFRLDCGALPVCTGRLSVFFVPCDCRRDGGGGSIPGSAPTPRCGGG